MLTILISTLSLSSGYKTSSTSQTASGLISGLKFPQDSSSCISSASQILPMLEPCISMNITDTDSIIYCLNSVKSSLSPIPEQLTACKPQLKEDCTRLLNTFPIFQHPLQYNLTVNSRIVLNNVEITEDLLYIQAYLVDSQEFEAAASLGELAKRLFLRESQEKDADEFFKGFVSGVGLLSEVYNCLQNPEVALKELEDAFKLLDRKNNRKYAAGIKGIYNAIHKITKQISACDKKYDYEVKKIETALKVLRYPYYYKLKIAEDILLNGVSIERDLKNAVRAFKEHYYYDLGYDIGYFITKFE